MKPQDQYEKNGYVILRDFLSNKEIVLIDQHVDRIYQKWVSVNQAEIFKHKLVNMHSLTNAQYFQDASQQRAEFFEAIASVKLTDALESLFGSGILTLPMSSACLIGIEICSTAQYQMPYNVMSKTTC